MKLDGIQPIPPEPERTLTDDGRVRVLIVEDGFRDALYFTPDEWAALSASDLDAMKRERYDAWVSAQGGPPAPEPVPAVDALQQAMDALDQARQTVSDVMAAAVVEEAESVIASEG